MPKFVELGSVKSEIPALLGSRTIPELLVALPWHGALPKLGLGWDAREETAEKQRFPFGRKEIEKITPFPKWEGN